jgi:CxxC-x17-CxxC domain-containing protein
MVDGVTSRPFSAATMPPLAVDYDSKEAVIAKSRELYTKSREVVEKEINDWSGMMGSGDDKGSTDGKWKATCSTCGKDVFVPFEPQPGRPVYCKDCMVKIKSGELKPVQNFKTNPHKEVQNNSALAMLGIEFKQESNSSPQPSSESKIKSTNNTVASLNTVDRPRPQQTSFTPKASSSQSSVSTKAPEANQMKPIASEAERVMKKNTFVHPPRRVPDREDLGKVLAEAMGGVGKTFAPKQEGSTPVPAASKIDEPKMSLSELKPKQAVSNSQFARKEQSEENKDELRKALAMALGKKDEKVSESGGDKVSEAVESKVIEEKEKFDKEQKEREKIEDEKKRVEEEKRAEVLKQQKEEEEKIKQDQAIKAKIEAEKLEVKKKEEEENRKREEAIRQAEALAKEEEEKRKKEAVAKQNIEESKASSKSTKEVPEDVLRKILEV